MSKRARRFLTIAFSDDAVRVAQVHGNGNAHVEAESALALSASLSLADPATLGKALADQLKRDGLTARDAVVGLSAKHVSARHRSVPAGSDADARADIVRLAVEREYRAAADELLFDVADGPTHGGEAHLLQVAARREHVDAVTQTMKHAGLNVTAITVTALEVANTLAAPGDDLLLITANGVEAAVRYGGRCIGLSRHTIDPAAIGENASPLALRGVVQRALGTDARRLLNGDANNHGLALRFNPDCADDTRTRIRESLSDRVTDAAGDAIAPARMIADSINAYSGPVVDLAHSKLAPPTPSRFAGRGRVIIYLAAAVVLAVVLWAVYHVQGDMKLKGLAREYGAMEAEAVELQAVRDQLRVASPWFVDRSDPIACLAALTDAFPERGRISAISLRLDEDMVGTLKCRASSEALMHECVQRMGESAELTNVRLRDWNQPDRARTDVTFDITFQFVPSKGGA